MAKYVFFITGASGTGKTSLVSALKKKYKKKYMFLHFDSIGVPTQEDMVKQSGSLENWQRDMTFKWIKKILSQHSGIVIFEGQVNLKFIQEGFLKENFSNYKIILIDCDEGTMTRRLAEDRKQPELLTKDMKNWLRFLRKQAKDFNATIINTSNKTETEVLKAFEKIAERSMRNDLTLPKGF